MYLLEDLRTATLNFNSVMIQIIHKILVLIKNLMNYLQDKTFVLLKRSNKLFFNALKK